MEINNIRTGYVHTKSAGQRSAAAKEAGEESFFDKMKDAAESSKNKSESLSQTTEEMMQFIRERKQEIIKKVRKGETEVKIRIGAQEFTQKEWNKLIESFDESEEDFRKKLREAREQQRKAMAERAGQTPGTEAETEETLIDKLLAD